MSARRHKNFTRGLSFSKYTQREDWEGGKAGREERLGGRKHWEGGKTGREGELHQIRFSIAVTVATSVLGGHMDNHLHKMFVHEAKPKKKKEKT